jgi:hypothetical protein
MAVIVTFHHGGFEIGLRGQRDGGGEQCER